MAKVIIVHGRQVVMDERIDMHAFGGGGGTQRWLSSYAEKRGALADEKGTEALAAAKGCVTHGLGDAAFRSLDARQQPVEHFRDIVRHRGKRGLEGFHLC